MVDDKVKQLEKELGRVQKQLNAAVSELAVSRTSELALRTRITELEKEKKPTVIPVTRHHRWRQWSGHRFGTPAYAAINSYTGRNEPVEPFPGACGDCGKSKEEH